MDRTTAITPVIVLASAAGRAANAWPRRAAAVRSWHAGAVRPLPRYGHWAATIGTVILVVILITVAIAAVRFTRRRR